MSEVKRYIAGDIFDGAEVVYASDFDRVTAERDAALGREDALREALEKQIARTNDFASKLTGLQQRLTAADERADVPEGLLRLLAELPGVRTSGMWDRVVGALKPASPKMCDCNQGRLACNRQCKVEVGGDE